MATQPRSKRLLTEKSVAEFDWISNYVREALSRPLPEDTPTIAYSLGSASLYTTPVEYKCSKVGAGSKTTNWDGLDDPNFRYWPGRFMTSNGGNGDLGLSGETKPGGAAQAAGYVLTPYFLTTSDQVEMFFYSIGTTSTPIIRVNGKAVSDMILTRVVVGNSFKINIVFPTSRLRKIEIMGSSGFSGVRVPAGNTISKPPAPSRIMCIIGDSWVNGAGSGQTGGAQNTETFAPQLLTLLGADEMGLMGIGGTGWLATGATSSYRTRIAATLALNPQVLVFYGSQNDGTPAAGLLRAEVAAVLAMCSAVPTIYVIGTALNNAYTAASAEVKAATIEAGRTFIDMEGYISGAGKMGAPVGRGNGDFFKYTDGVHPTFLAHKALAETMFRRIYTRD